MSEYEGKYHYFPEKERKALKEIDIEEKQYSRTSIQILKRLNLKQSNSIKGLGCGEDDDGY